MGPGEGGEGGCINHTEIDHTTKQPLNHTPFETTSVYVVHPLSFLLSISQALSAWWEVGLEQAVNVAAFTALLQ